MTTKPDDDRDTTPAVHRPDEVETAGDAAGRALWRHALIEAATRRPPPFSGDPDEKQARPAGAIDDGSEFDDDATTSRPAGASDPRSDCMIMERAALTDAIRLAGYDGSFDALSREDEVRARLLLHYRDSTPLFRRHLVGSPAMLARLEDLASTTPNFAAVTTLAQQAATLSSLTGRPLRLPVILLLGSPGTGKTHYAKQLATALGTTVEIIAGTTLADTKALTGYGPAWRGSGPSRIAKALIGARTTAPLIFLDEAEKITDYDVGRPLDRMLTLLERHSARAFTCEYLQVPMRADHVLWVFAVNSLEGLSQPFLDRVITIKVPDLDADQRRAVLGAMLAEVVAELGLPLQPPDPGLLDTVLGLGLRRARLAFELAIGTAAARGRRFLVAADLAAAVRLMGAGGERQPIGFLRPSHPATNT